MDIHTHVFATRRGYRPLELDLYLPPSPGPFPVVVWVHGGGWQEGSRRLMPDTIAPFGFHERLVGRGYAVAAVDYRLALEAPYPAQLEDVQSAIAWLRGSAERFDLDPARFATFGESAGGHLASTLATHFDPGDAAATDEVDRESSRPDFLILCYPVITMTEKHMHAGSRRNLLGESPDAELARSLSNDSQVTAQTPPTFIFQTDEDEPVPAENCVSFYLALRRAGVPAEMHIFEKGPHGVGLGQQIRGTKAWPDLCRDWMHNRGLL